MFFYLLLYVIHAQAVHATPAYYQPRSYGSDSLYSPFSNFLSYTFDTLQLPENFGTSNFSENTQTVLDHLGDPKQAIDNEGGFNRFVNRQIFPIDSEYTNESYQAAPNYFLHLLGGGMVYRKDLEWFHVHDYEYATSSAVVLAMTAEFLQEVLEKNTTTDDDEVADFIIFRPIGMLLFHNDAVANFVMDYLDPAIWPSLQVYDLSEERINNAGLHYIYRPTFFELGNAHLFLYTGLNNMLGLSHRLKGGDSFSWGIGKSTQRVDLNLDKQVKLKNSAGVFYDRNKSLLASLVLNDTGGNRFRFNWYPGNKSMLGKLGYFASQRDDGSFSTGVVYKIQLGIGFTVK
ncbi:MAG: hypothetical protein KJN89_13555 [Gammaproteobacteria bacterium]|nr:hypothetical protein [Gammaproteobacteria bacterium]MBT8134388.1 hypothetical protein [Gammaproteobacteria bacterium]NNJ51397.1 hypothetical protein [Gammaproteobacteria bacterium]